MKKPLLTYRILFLCAGLLLAATGLVHAQAPCRKFVKAFPTGRGGYLAIANDGTLWSGGGGGGRGKHGTERRRRGVRRWVAIMTGKT